MTRDEYTAVFVGISTKQELKELSVKEGRTFDQMVQSLMVFYKLNKKI